MPSRCSPRLAEAEHLVEIVSCGDIGGDVVAAGQVVHHQRLAETSRTAEEQEAKFLLLFLFLSVLMFRELKKLKKLRKLKKLSQ